MGNINHQFLNRKHILFFIFFGLNAFLFAQNNTVVYLRLNQLGYRPHDPKTAVAFSAQPVHGEFRIVSKADGKTVYSGKPVPIRRSGWGKFGFYYRLDFSDLKTGGKYELKIGGSVSVPFQIQENLYRFMPDSLLNFMRQQRCGYNPFWDEVCHSLDGRTAYGPLPPGTYLDAAGGWHDAGDDLKYLLTGSYAAAIMLFAYAMSPETFSDHFNKYGQPFPNRIPDVLDEARWGLEWMLKLHPAKDQLYHQVGDDRDHIGWKFPFRDSSDYGWGKNSYRVVYFADGKPQGLKQFKSRSTGVANLAGRYAAAMALAYRIWKNDLNEPESADRFLRAGIEVYQLGKQKEGVQQGNSYNAPYRYAEITWADDMEWGAAELFRVTKDSSYLQDAIRYARQIGSASWMAYDSTDHYAYYPFLNVGHFALYPLVNRSLQKELAAYYRTGIEQCFQRAEKNAFHIGVPFIWCSNNLVAALISQCALYEKMTGDHRFRRFMVEQRDWLLGRNPWGTSMFVGIPEHGEFPEHPHASTYALTRRSLTGGLVDGPVYGNIFGKLKGLYLSEADPFAPFQSDYVVYHDDIADYSTNEPTMDGTAAAILAMMVFALP
ncbi:MAG: glycoside hydrolase family 9 [Calditrichaeota bacterium]|nr:glycoside hydrolase family 9 [Calditrichota bacterium]